MEKENPQKKKIIVAITGATGTILGIRALQILRQAAVETHLIISHPGRMTIAQETDWSLADIEGLAAFTYKPEDIGAQLASGTFRTDGMIILPCSIKSLSEVANAHNHTLITRAADVCLKEGRPLLLAVRETPLHRGHLRLMDLAARAGAIIAPPMPVYYHRPRDLDEMNDAIVQHMLRRIGIEPPQSYVWPGISDRN